MAAERNPIWELSDGEVKRLAKAIQLCQQEFDVPVSDRAVAIGAMGSALWFIYGTRISALYMEAQARRNAAKQPQKAPLGLRPAPAAQPPPQPPPQAPPQPPPGQRPGDVIQPQEGYINGAASFAPSPTPAQPATLIDPVELARAIANPLPPNGKPN